MKESGRTGEESEGDTSSTEGLIEDDEDEDQNVQVDQTKADSGVMDLGTDTLRGDLDLLDSAFLREGITLEPEKDSSESDDSDGLYDFKDTLGVQQFPADIDSKKHFLFTARQPRRCEYLYGKRYTARCVRKVDPSQLPSLMSLKVEPPERVTVPKRPFDDDSDVSKLVQKLQKPLGRRRRGSPEVSNRRMRSRPRSRSPRRLAARERIHRSPTGIERFRYWAGREYRSRNRSPPPRRPRHQ